MDIVEFTQEEYDYLKALGLNLTKPATEVTNIYFDYDFVEQNIDKTPAEIDQMADTIDKKTLQWFDDLFLKCYKNFYDRGGDFFDEYFYKDKELSSDKWPINDKSSDAYKKYIDNKKIFALTLKMMTEGKASTIMQGYHDKNVANVFDDQHQEVCDYVSSLNKLLNNSFQTPDEDFWDIDITLGTYKQVLGDKKKPTITYATDIFDKLVDIVDRSVDGKSLNSEETKIAEYLCKIVREKSLADAMSINNPAYVENTVDIAFAIIALIDSSLTRENSKTYKAIFEAVFKEKLKGSNKKFSDIVPGSYNGSEAASYAEKINDWIEKKLKVSNDYQKFSLFLLNKDKNYSYLKRTDSMTKDEIAAKNKSFFEHEKDGKEISYIIKSDKDSSEQKTILTNDEIDADKKIIEQTNTSLGGDESRANLINELLRVIADKFNGQELTEADEKLLTDNGIDKDANLLTLYEKGRALTKELDQLNISKIKNTNKINTLEKANNVLESSKKKGINKSNALKKWAKNIVSVACPLAGVVIGSKLAFSLGPVGIVATSAAGALLAAQAKAHADYLEEQELQNGSIKVTSITSPSAKIVDKADKFVRKTFLYKLSNSFNIFNKLANTRFNKINNFFNNKNTLRNIEHTLTASVAAMDLTALARVLGLVKKSPAKTLKRG